MEALADPAGAAEDRERVGAIREDDGIPAITRAVEGVVDDHLRLPVEHVAEQGAGRGDCGIVVVHGFVLSIALPDELPVEWVEKLYDGIRLCCKKYRVNLLGGDVTGSPRGIILTGTVLGIVPEGKAVPRSGAEEGDLVFVTETIGDSAAGLYAILHGKGKDWPFLVKRHRRPEPQIEKGILLRKAGAHSLNDISDGLSRELNEIASASQVEIEINPSLIPLSKEARKLAAEVHMDPLSWAFNGGEDYELTGTISPESFDTIERKDGITVIGRVTGKGHGVYLKENGSRKLLKIHGYDHFVK